MRVLYGLQCRYATITLYNNVFPAALYYDRYLMSQKPNLRNAIYQTKNIFICEEIRNYVCLNLISCILKSDIFRVEMYLSKDI